MRIFLRSAILLALLAAFFAEPAFAQRGALSLDGQGYASVADSAPVNISGTELAIEAWVRHDGTSDEDAIILTKGTDGEASMYQLRFVGAGEEVPVLFAVRFGTGVTSTSGIPAHRWTHIAAVYDGAELALYIDGVPDATVGFNRDQGTNGMPLRIGTNNSANGQFFSGEIDEIRLWDTSRTFLEVQAGLYDQLDGTEDGLAVYWTFDNEMPFTGETGAAVVLEPTGDATTAAPGALPVAPDLYASAGNAQADLQWAQRPGTDAAAEFKLYRSTQLDGSDRTEVATIDGATTSYTDTDTDNGTTFFYEVTAIDAGGQESGFSSPASVQPYSTLGGHALSLGGQGYATATNRPSIGLPGTGYAIEAWVKHDGTSDEDAIILTKGTDGEASMYQLRFVGAGEEVPVLFAVRFGTGVTSTSGIPAHRWTHIAAVYDGAELALYIDGELDSTSPFTRDQGTNEMPLRIGTNNSANGQFFSGKIDEIRLWSDARSAEQVEQDYLSQLTGLEEGLRAYWRFDGSSAQTTRGAATTHQTLELAGDAEVTQGGVAPVVPDVYAVGGDDQAVVEWAQRSSTDAAAEFTLYRSTQPDGSDRTEIATIDGATTSYTDTDTDNGTTYFYEVTAIDAGGQESDFAHPALASPAQNADGNALHLDGDGDFASVTDRPSLNLTGTEFAVEAWVKHDGTSNENAIILGKGTAADASMYQFLLVGAGEEVPVSFNVRFGTGVTSATTISAGVWTHVAGVYNGEQLALYINGELDATSPFNRDQGTNERSLTIGANAAGDGAFFSGEIDEIRIWSDARTQGEVQASLGQSLLGNEEGLLAYWRFNETAGAVARSSAGRPKTAFLQGDASFTPSEATPVEEPGTELPTDVALHGNYPNPFNPVTTISYALPEAVEVRLSVYDALGRRVATLLDGRLHAPGTYEVTFEAGGLSSGTYLYRLEAGGQVRTGRMLLLK